MKQVHFSVKPNKNTKQQALEVITKLKEVIPIEKAQMKLRVICNKKHRKSLKEMAAEVEEDTVSGDGILEIVSYTLIISEIIHSLIANYRCF